MTRTETAGKTARGCAHGARRFRANRIRPICRRVVLTRIAADALAVIDRAAAQSGMTRGDVISATFRKLGKEAAI